MLGLRKGPSAHLTALAMVAARPGDEAVVVGADAAELAAELARVTGLNGRTRVVDAAEAASVLVQSAAAAAGSLVEFELIKEDRFPIEDACEDVAVVSPAVSAGMLERPRRIEEVLRVLRGGGRVIALARRKPVGWGSLFNRRAQAVDVEQLVSIISRAGFRGARVLGEANGIAYVEAIKSR